MPEAPIRVLLVDDHQIVREGLRAVLEDEPRVFVCGEAADGTQAIARARSLQPEVVLLDLMMPGPSPVETIEGLRAACPTARIVVLTSFADEEQVHDVVAAGAVGYLVKDVSKGELLMAIRSARDGQPLLHREAQRHLVARSRRAPEPDRFDKLTPRERSILGCIARGLSNRDTARELKLSEGTVKGYVSAVLEKLGVGDRTQAALLAVRHGFDSGPATGR
jgi:DNA-binding NarL/FixJ family response regulator